MNTPTPPKRNRYPFDKMKVDGYEKIKFPELLQAKKARMAVHSLGSRTGKKFVTHLVDDGLEVWRVL